MEEINLDNELKIIALKPKEANLKSRNDTSIILIFQYKNFDAVLMGDNETNKWPTCFHPLLQ